MVVPLSPMFQRATVVAARAGEATHTRHTAASRATAEPRTTSFSERRGSATRTTSRETTGSAQQSAFLAGCTDLSARGCRARRPPFEEGGMCGTLPTMRSSLYETEHAEFRDMVRGWLEKERRAVPRRVGEGRDRAAGRVDLRRCAGTARLRH